MTSDGALPAMNDASDDTTRPSAPPLTSCSAQTDFVDDECGAYGDDDDAERRSLPKV